LILSWLKWYCVIGYTNISMFHTYATIGDILYTSDYCGEAMKTNIPYVVSQNADAHLVDFCKERHYNRFFLIADNNTYSVLGSRIENSLRNEGIDVKTILLTGEEISTDEHYIMQTLIETNGEDRQYIAVGSGTITDITRFVSHRARANFISIPTAASVDGFTSTVAPMVFAKYKGPIQAQPPIAVFADLPTLCAAPQIMTAAGLGDLLGKYTSLADWKLGQLLYDEPYNAEVDQKMRESVDKTVASLDQLAAGSCTGITNLMDGLIGSGFGMLEFGDSRPASGSEHHIAHYWEMKYILEGRPAVLHGVKVGIATILAAKRYELLSQITYADAEHRLNTRVFPSQDQFQKEILKGYGVVTNKILAIQAPLLRMTPMDFDILKKRILANWDQIHQIALGVPRAEEIRNWIKALNGPTLPQEIGLSDAEVVLGMESAHYLRDRFTLNRLGFWLNLPLGIG
jgi:glycerol-1-phosphate dehydrogenase [NAD(P)+]